MKAILTLAIATSFLTSAIFASEAQSEKQANEATEYRQSIFKLVKSNVGPLGGMARGKLDFDAEVVKTNAARLNQLAMMIPDYFKLNTTNFSVSTEALPKIWSNMADFNDKASAFETATAKLVEVANGGDEGATKKAIGDMFKTCKSCHDEYKAD